MKKMLAAAFALAALFFLGLQSIQAGEASQAPFALPESFSKGDGRTSLEGKYAGYNVVLIILDALRPDFLSCYGYPKKTSPNIDALAKQGVVFENAFSQSSLTLSSVTTIFTSLYPQSHNVRMVLKDRVPERMYTLAQILSFYDYETVWFGDLKDPHSGSADGLLKGFKEKYAIEGDKIVSWIAAHKQKPFFLTLHSYLTHEKFFPFLVLNNTFSNGVSPEFKELLVHMKNQVWEKLQEQLRTHPESLYDVLGKDWVEEHRDYFFLPYSESWRKKIFDHVETSERYSKLMTIYHKKYSSIFSEFSQEQLADYLSLLDGAIFEADEKFVGPLVGELKRANIFDKTIIIITADHGNEYFEHGHFGHGTFIYDESIHVPLIVYAPNLFEPLRKKELVQNADIMPSLLRLLKIPLPHQAQGVSFVDLMQNKKEEIVPPHKFIFAESNSGAQCIRSADWKFIQNTAPGTGHELFDLRNDPLEKRNVINENKQVAEDLEKRLNDWRAGLTVYSDSQGEFSPEIDEQTKENIRKTGYW